jgi:hypothetical protein
MASVCAVWGVREYPHDERRCFALLCIAQAMNKSESRAFERSPAPPPSPHAVPCHPAQRSADRWRRSERWCVRGAAGYPSRHGIPHGIGIRRRYADMAFANIPNRSVIITEGDLALNPLNYRQLCASFPLMRGALSYMPHARSTRRTAHRMRDRSSARRAACERAADSSQDNSTRMAPWHGGHSSNVRGRTAARLWLNVAVCWNMEQQTTCNTQQTTDNTQHTPRRRAAGRGAKACAAT